MNNLTNSIVRGFGTTIGRKAANKVTDFKSSRDSKNYLTFWEAIKTFFWFFPMIIVSTIANLIWDLFTKDTSAKNYHPSFASIMFWAILFTLIIGYDYYNKKR